MLKKLKNKISFRTIEVSIIFFFWILLFSSPLFIGRYNDNVDWDRVFRIWKDYLPLLALFFLNRLLLMPQLFFKNKRGLYFISLLILIISGSIGLSSYNSKHHDRAKRAENISTSPVHPKEELTPHLPPHHRPPRPTNAPDHPKPPNQLPPELDFIIMAILFIGFDIALQVTVKWLKSEQEKVSLEKDNIENQLAFLKNQVSPHFFMNTLNNIHALIDFDKEGAKNSVIKLSNLMRYLLYDSETKQSRISQEIEFIHSYVELMKLRFIERVNITLKIPDIIPNKSIPPLLFISLLENAFKHGVSYTSNSFINIELSCSEEYLVFNIENSSIKQTEKQKASGIGIENTKRRLNLLYADNYSLVFEDLDHVFKVNLKIPI
jgi:two-component sensor histidine kinase